MERVVPSKEGGHKISKAEQAARQQREAEEQGRNDADETFRRIVRAEENNAAGYVPLVDDEGHRTRIRDWARSGARHFPDAPPNTLGTKYQDGQWHPQLEIDQERAADKHYRDSFLARLDERLRRQQREDADTTQYLEAGIPRLPRVRPYSYWRRFKKPGQGHHINQHAAVRQYVSRNAGATLKLKGNAITDVGSPHYEFHREMEKFWKTYRSGSLAGKKPTITEHSAATMKALVKAGLAPDVAKFVADVARRQLTVLHKLPASTRLPVPKHLGQVRPK